MVSQVGKWVEDEQGTPASRAIRLEGKHFADCPHFVVGKHQRVNLCLEMLVLNRVSRWFCEVRHAGAMESREIHQAIWWPVTIVQEQMFPSRSPKFSSNICTEIIVSRKFHLEWKKEEKNLLPAHVEISCWHQSLYDEQSQRKSKFEYVSKGVEIRASFQGISNQSWFWNSGIEQDKKLLPPGENIRTYQYKLLDLRYMYLSVHFCSWLQRLVAQVKFTHCF